jgi:hypothetical protein
MAAAVVWNVCERDLTFIYWHWPWFTVSTRSVLKSYVSSKTADVYKIFAPTNCSGFALPTCCAYSHGKFCSNGICSWYAICLDNEIEAKRGLKPLLAVGTQCGIVEIINASKREPWEEGEFFCVLRISSFITHKYLSASSSNYTH